VPSVVAPVGTDIGRSATGAEDFSEEPMPPPPPRGRLCRTEDADERDDDRRPAAGTVRRRRTAAEATRGGEAAPAAEPELPTIVEAARISAAANRTRLVAADIVAYRHWFGVYTRNEESQSVVRVINSLINERSGRCCCYLVQ